MKGWSLFRAVGEVSSQEEVVLSCPAEEASCLGGAYPLERRDPDQVACPLEDPSVVACQGAVPSYLEVGLLCPWGAGLLAQVGTGSAPQRCWRLLLRQQPSLDPAASSPAAMVRPHL